MDTINNAMLLQQLLITITKVLMQHNNKLLSKLNNKNNNICSDYMRAMTGHTANPLAAAAGYGQALDSYGNGNYNRGKNVEVFFISS